VDGSSVLALDGATAVLGFSEADVKAALDRHAHGGGINAADYDQALAGLKQGTLLQLYGNLAGVLASSKAAKAHAVPWIAAIRSYAAAVSFDHSGASVDFRVDTRGAALTAAQLPLATGSSAPRVASDQPISAGLRDAAHAAAFAEAAAQVIDPAGYRKFLADQAKEGINIDRDLIAQLTGDVLLSATAGGGAAARVGVKDPAAVARTLSRLHPTHGKLTRTRDGFYMLLRPGHKPLYVGLAGSVLLIGSAQPAALRAFASAPTAPVAGAKGAFAFRVSLAPLVKLAMTARPLGGGAPPAGPLASLNPIVEGIFGQLGDLTGWATDDPSGLHGRVTLPFK
jgi:hypothetical protein